MNFNERSLTMGTDAIAFLETRNRGGADWQGEDLGRIRRNYRIFDAIAGGRSGAGSQLIDPRGIPPDASLQVLCRACHVIDDAKAGTSRTGTGTVDQPSYIHSSNVDTDFTIITHANGDRFAYRFSAFGGYIRGHTWLSADELEACFAVPGAMDNHAQNWTDLVSRMREFERGGTPVRIVIWFMN